jgi:hypothetical protein
MNAQSRMAKTLGCLVGAMTLGTVVLQFIEPSTPVANEGYARRLLALEMRRAVRPEAASEPARWEGIVVRANGRPAGGEAAPHFEITSQGRLVATDAWHGQHEAGAPRFIEVAVDAASGSDAKAPTGQDDTLVALLTELRGTYVVSGGRVQLDESSFAAAGRRARGADYAKHLKSLLRDSGLTG